MTTPQERHHGDRVTSRSAGGTMPWMEAEGSTHALSYRPGQA